MEAAVAYSTLAVTVGLAVSRPRLGWRDLRATPGIAAILGVFLLFVTRILDPADLWLAAKIQWRPLLALTCIMVMTGVVREVGAFERLALYIEARARMFPAARTFDVIFLLSVVTPALLNNDAAILLLTPIVVALVRRLYPGDERLMQVFVFAVFLAPGVAPLIISNPMNMIVAEFAGLGFNAYAKVMAPISVVGAILTFAMLRLHFREALRARPLAAAPPAIPERHPAERPALGFLLAVFFAYPVLAAVGAPIWSVAVAGAVGCLVIARHYRVATPRKLAGHVSVDTLAFLWGVFLVVAGLREVGVVDSLAGLYHAQGADLGRQIGVVGVTSAVGSAVVDNHPMALLNMMALEQSDVKLLLAALVGGDIGPRLLPIGSLAGLLWIDLLRRRGVEIRVGQFVRLGTLTLVPTLVASLVMLRFS